MFRSFKIFLIVLSLGAFILPKQMIFAQQTEQCCDQKKHNDGCCGKNESQSCHDSNSKKDSEQKDCGKDCANCHSCTVFSVLNFVSPEIFNAEPTPAVHKSVNFNYEFSFISSDFQNIWQPPKIA